MTGRLANVPGQYAVFARCLDDDGQGIAIAADDVFYAASVMKLPIMVEAFRQAHYGQISLEQTVVMRESDRVGGSGIMQLLSPGVALNVWDLIRLMICVSDNTATNLLVNLLGLDTLNQSFQGWGLQRTRLVNPLQVQPVDATARNVLSASDMGLLLEHIARGRLVSVWACERMISILKQQQIRGEISSGLPPARDGPIGALPAFSVAHKGGWMTGIRHDVGIVYGRDRTYVLCLLGKNVADDDAARAAYRDVSWLCFEHFLREGPSGDRRG